MTTIEKIRAEIERRTYEEQGFGKEDAEYGYRSCARDLLQFLDTLEEPVCEELEEAAKNIYKVPFGTRAEDFIAGAEWQKEQMMKEAVEGEVSIRGCNGAEGKGFVYESGGIKFIIIKKEQV